MFTHHLISFNEMAGRKSEAARLRELKRDQDAEWKPSQLDNLFVLWLEASNPNVHQAMSNPDDLNDKILRTMAMFTEAAFFMLPPDDYEHDETLRRTVLVFLFGALDAVTQQFFFESHEKLAVLDAYLQQAFPSMSEEERESFIIFLADSSDDPTWIPVMQRGGQTLVDWGRGNTTAPLMLSHIIHFGIDDADTMRTPKPDDRNA